jgi:hypothetical protein
MFQGLGGDGLSTASQMMLERMLTPDAPAPAPDDDLIMQIKKAKKGKKKTRQILE